MDLSTRAGRAEQGRRIQAAAGEAGFSLAELAQRLGCSRALLYQYVGGQVLAQPDRVQAIAAACGRSLAWFYTAEDAPLPVAERDAELARLQQELAAEQVRFEQGRGQELIGHLSQLGEAQGNPPDFAAQRRTYERLAERAEELGQREPAAEAWFRLGNACYASGDYEATRAATTRAVAAFRELRQPDRERAARQTLGAALAGLGERDRALAEFDAVLAGGGFADLWRGRLGRADVFEALGRGEAALDELSLAEAALADQPDGPERRTAELYLTAATVNVYLLHDDFGTALASAMRSVPLAEELAAVSQHLEARLNCGVCQRRLGQWVEASASYDDALRLARLTADEERQATARALRAELLAALGRFEEAKREGKDALAASLALGSVRGEIWSHLALSEAYRRAGDANEALYHARQGVAAAAGRGLIWFETLLRVLAAKAQRRLDGGGAAEARRAMAAAEAIGARWVRGLAALELAAAGDAELLAVAADAAAQTGEWELRLATAAPTAGQQESAGAVLNPALDELLALRDRLAEAGVEAGLLEDEERLTAVRVLLTEGTTPGASELVETWLERAAWPPLTELVRAHKE